VNVRTNKREMKRAFLRNPDFDPEKGIPKLKRLRQEERTVRQPALFVGPNASEKASFGNLWVHLQDAPDGTWTPFTVVVPKEMAEEVFDRTHARESGEPLLDYAMQLVTELGTYIVEAFLDNLRRLSGQNLTHYTWVIASIDNLSERDGDVVMEGKVVPLRPSAD
jgi:hypothetical protein